MIDAERTIQQLRNDGYDDAVDLILRFAAEVDAALASRDRYWGERNDALAAADSKAGWEWKKRAEKAEAERDAAVADAASLRERMLVLEEQRDKFHSEAFQSEKARRKDAKDAGRWNELCRQIDLTMFPCAILDDAMAMGAGALELYIEEAMKEQEQGK